MIPTLNPIGLSPDGNGTKLRTAVSDTPYTREHQRIASQHIGLVRKVANRFYQTQSHTIDELISIGTIGLMKAVTRFDPAKGFAFSSFAVPFIRGEIQHWLRDKRGELVRSSRDEKAPIVNSLDVGLGGEPDGLTKLDLIADEPPATPELSDNQERLRSAILQLDYPIRDAMILVNLNGLTQKEAANWLGVAAMSVSRYIDSGTHRLKAHFLRQQPIASVRPRHSRPPGKTRKRSSGAIELPYRSEAGEVVFPLRLVCQRCQAVFGRWRVSQHPPKYCNRTCSSKAVRDQQHQRKKGSSWSEPEIATLVSLIGRYQLQDVIDRYQAECIAKNYPRRTRSAIRTYIKRLPLSQRSTADNWAMRELARQLDISPERVRNWVRIGRLPYRKVAAHIGSISRIDFAQFCQSYPQHLGGIDQSKLANVLQDDGLAQQCLARSGGSKTIAVRVQRIDTGIVYPTRKAAARALKMQPVHVRQECARGDGWLKERGRVRPLSFQEAVSSVKG